MYSEMFALLWCNDTKVIDSRYHQVIKCDVVRECLLCEEAFTTFETVISVA